MIIGKMIGGLGNQMFCYAFARSLHLKYGGELYLDIQVYNRYKIRDYRLDRLNIPHEIKNADVDYKSNSFLKLTQLVYSILTKTIKSFFRSDVIGKKLFTSLGKKGLYYNLDRYYYDIPLSNKSKKYTYGYFQSEKYFREYRNQIKQELKVSVEARMEEKDLLDRINIEEAVGVSIRWGEDYFNSNLNVCSKQYYYSAMELIANKVENPTFYIFSDCIEDVKREFNFKYPVHFIEGFKEHESLRLLYSCRYFVIANSSFSWWGAYLSDYKNKLIVAPSKWYKNSTNQPDIYLDEMMLIEVD